MDKPNSLEMSEKEFSSAVENTISSNSGDDMLLSDEDNLFLVIQGIIWQIIKVIIILAIISIPIWLLWNKTPEEDHPKDTKPRTEENIKPQTEAPNKTKDAPQAKSKKDSALSRFFKTSEDKTQYDKEDVKKAVITTPKFSSFHQSIYQSASWLKKAQTLSLKLQHLVKGQQPTIAIKTQRFSEVLQEIKIISSEYARLQKILVEETAILGQNLALERQNLSRFDRNTWNAVVNNNPNDLTQNLIHKKQTLTLITSYQSEIEIRQSIIKNMRGFMGQLQAFRVPVF